MFTRLVVENFKRFGRLDIELGNPVVLIGPNNSGKTTALQALSLWNIGMKRVAEKRQGPNGPGNTRGTTISRRDIVGLPVPDAQLLWRDLEVLSEERVDNVLIVICVEGIADGVPWRCGLEFEYANEESFCCRPLRAEGAEHRVWPTRVQKVALLPPMSGLAAVEPKWEPGRIDVLIGEGQTAQVLRNLCHGVCSGSPERWSKICAHIERLFGVTLDEPQYMAERGEIVMTYRQRPPRSRSDTRFDISASGRGLQQMLFLLAYIYANPKSVLLLDEPDAHLEILRQRHIYQLITEIAREQGSQIIAASHSEVVLNEAAGRDVVIAFVGKPHRIDDRGSQGLKALANLGFDQYYQAEETGWVLYLEASTDLAILQALAKKLDHPAIRFIDQPFAHYVANQPQKARDHFFGLKEAKEDLMAVAIYDRLDRDLQNPPGLREVAWKRCEIENYLCFPEVLTAYAAATVGEVGEATEADKRKDLMEQCVKDLVPPVALRDRKDRWWSEVKASDDFLDRLFDVFFERLQQPNLMRKNNYYKLADFITAEMIDSEIIEKLDAIVEIASSVYPHKEPFG